MSVASILPIAVADLLYLRGVESARVEFKQSWDAHVVGPQVLATICAFANDFHNLNGGYIVIGVGENQGRALLPPSGLPQGHIEAAQQWLRGRCNTLDPVYQPVLSPETVDGKAILVVWAPASQVRPHQAPGSAARGVGRGYFVRIGSSTVAADSHPELLTQLLQLTARVPFDDRRDLHASTSDLREAKVREFLHEVGSGLVDEPEAAALYRALRIADPVNGHDAPRNIGLMCFSQDPERWFVGARIEVVQFGDAEGGDILLERKFAARAVHEQLRDCLAYLQSVYGQVTSKRDDRPQADRTEVMPSTAIREALVNAVYHRSYEGEPEPTKVYIYPDRLEIISYPGPAAGIALAQFRGQSAVPPLPARNRRIGEILKELRLAEGRGTGIAKLHRAMRDNGSPPPQFDFDEARSYFRVTLQVR